MLNSCKAHNKMKHQNWFEVFGSYEVHNIIKH
jgi:hypothetical protein